MKVICINCNKVYERDEYTDTTHTSNIHTCPFCGSEFYKEIYY